MDYSCTAVMVIATSEHKGVADQQITLYVRPQISRSASRSADQPADQQISRSADQQIGGAGGTGGHGASPNQAAQATRAGQRMGRSVAQPECRPSPTLYLWPRRLNRRDVCDQEANTTGSQEDGCPSADELCHQGCALPLLGSEKGSKARPLG